MKEMYVVENNHIDENTWAIYQICYICGNGQTNVVQIKGTGIALCKKCLERGIELLNEYQQKRFQAEFEESRKDHIDEMPNKPALTGCRGIPQ